jgi:hypothetical protein
MRKEEEKGKPQLFAAETVVAGVDRQKETTQGLSELEVYFFFACRSNHQDLGSRLF